MNTALRTFSLSASAIGVALLVSACGGGDAEPPPDIDPPTLAITDNVAAATATGPVTFTFTFSEDVGSSFVLEDIVVTGGAAGALAKSSDTVYTLVVTPPDDSVGTLGVAVAAAKYRDLSNNDNVSESSASQAFSTVVTPPPTGTGTSIVSFDEEPPVSLGAFGDAAPSIAAAPTGGTGAALKLDRSGAINFGGTFFTLPQAIPFAADRKTITARVYATRANAKVFLKVEAAGGVATEVSATTGAANTWQTLTWVLDGVNPANSYTVMVFSADTDVPNLGAQTYWIDEVTLADAATGSTDPATSVVSFDEEPPVSLGAFGDAAPSIAAAPTGGTGAALKLDRSGAINFGGTFFTLPQAIPFAADRKTITARVYATRANAKVFLKVEAAGGVATEVSATTGAANTWQTLTWVLDGVNPANSYTVMVFSADTDVPNLGAQTYWIDEVQLEAAAGGGGGTVIQGLPITFDDGAVTYVLRGFEGAEDSTLAVDPAGGTNMVGKVVRAAGGPWFGGTVVSTGPNESIATIPFTASATTMSMRFFSPAPGVRVRMKVENATDPTKTVETDAVSVGTGWETLIFNFANPGLAPPVTGGPTAPLDVTQTFNKVIVFFNVAAAGDAWAGTYYFDDIAFGTP